MNVSMQDTFNLGWKLAAVLEGRSGEELLHTYHAERHQIAHDLINLDSAWSKVMATPPKDPAHPERPGIDPAELQAAFIQNGRFTAGVATQYLTSVLTGTDEHQALATGFPVGQRFHSAPVVRLADAKPMQLGHVAKADGRWRLYAFADKDGGSRLRSLLYYLENDSASPITRFTPVGADLDSVFDLRAIFQDSHRDITIEEMPAILRPAVGKFGLRDYEKVFTPDYKSGEDIFEMRGIDRDKGALVIVRPDQYVSCVLSLDDPAAIGAFFEGFMTEQR
jgi:phenol 2-monooxygenase